MEKSTRDQRALDLIRKIYADVEAMHSPLQGEGVQFDILEGTDREAFFGTFETRYDWEADRLREDCQGVTVYWPNLWILMQEMRELIGQPPDNSTTGNRH
jgi:hypothetical protein